MSVAAILIAAFALVFSVASFWWLNERRGKLIVVPPHAFVIARDGSTVLLFRFPLVIYNTGAKATVVRDLQCRFTSEPSQVLPLPWRGTYSTLRDETASVREYPTAFPIHPREAVSMNVEMGGPFPGVTLEPGRTYAIRFELLTTHRKGWQAARPFNLTVPEEPWHQLAVYPLVDDEETRRRADRSAAELLERLKAEDTPTVD
jgi:hypothetical protein